ncbi:hypothetical protein HS088_TW04G00893 [Tripterygium wilfordii]|uniref:Uncharacterized protein n=1 Tax=Tripterygium wilfordii TaxID=458696 RepID=A0A7J7DRA5_TRIWF|nr:uncharacterized protein LOC119995838 [Tripterygium wilfordii]KAF5748932.1 hypothetical protein HS088_TW04G00893 [Tripterygium wilfordii]
MNSTLTKPKSCLRKARRRSGSQRRSAHAVCRGQRSNVNEKGKLSDKLEALKKLIPAHNNNNNNNNNGKTVKPDDLFQETADYIVLLKTQVVILQKLIHLYGPTATTRDEEQNQCVSS